MLVPACLHLRSWWNDRCAGQRFRVAKSGREAEARNGGWVQGEPSKPDRAMKIPITFFAPAEREPVEIVQRQARSISQSPLTRTFLDASLNYVFVLNTRRQIVMASETVLELVPDKTMDQIVGLRPGEALGCIHAYECESGCGTSQSCQLCGAVRVILKGLEGCRDLQECHLTRSIQGREESLDLRVLATPFEHDGQRYTLLALEGIRPRPR
jgi:hypothetical protein